MRASFVEPASLIAGILDGFDLLSAGFVHEGRRHVHEDVYFDLVLSPEEAARGGQVLIAIPFRRRCDACWGGGFECVTCGGWGEVVSERELRVLVPPGVRDGQRAALPLELGGLGGGVLSITVRMGDSRGE